MWKNPCASAPASGGYAGPTAEQIAEAIVSRLAETDIRVKPAIIKGQPVVALANQSAARTSDSIDMRQFNAVYVQVFVTGTNPSGTLRVQGSAYGAYQTLADANADKSITASTAYEVVVGSPQIRVELSSVSGTFAAGEGFTVIVTPFVSPGSPQIELNTDSPLPAGTNSIGGTTDNGPHWTSAFGVSGARFTSADQSGSAANVTDAPGTGEKLVITDLVISVDTAMRVDFKEETSGTVLLSLYMAANSTAQLTTRSKLKLPTPDTRLQVQTSAAGNIAVTAFYYSEA